MIPRVSDTVFQFPVEFSGVDLGNLRLFDPEDLFRGKKINSVREMSESVIGVVADRMSPTPIVLALERTLGDPGVWHATLMLTKPGTKVVNYDLFYLGQCSVGDGPDAQAYFERLK